MGEVTTASIASTPKSTTPTTFPSISGFALPSITTTHLSYSILSLKLPPRPCAVLLVSIHLQFLPSLRHVETQARQWWSLVIWQSRIQMNCRPDASYRLAVISGAKPAAENAVCTESSTTQWINDFWCTLRCCIENHRLERLNFVVCNSEAPYVHMPARCLPAKQGFRAQVVAWLDCGEVALGQITTAKGLYQARHSKTGAHREHVQHTPDIKWCISLHCHRSLWQAPGGLNRLL